MADWYATALKNAKFKALDENKPLDAPDFLAQLLQKDLITKVQDMELKAKSTYRDKIDGAFNVLFVKNPEPTYIKLQMILKELNREDIMDQVGIKSELDVETHAQYLAQQAMNTGINYEAMAEQIGRAMSVAHGGIWCCLVVEGTCGCFVGEDVRSRITFTLDDKHIIIWESASH
ncbi:unnamed protein product [Darwinula stevensoni]|uniref:Dynein light chain n=1 Tax=Darwinula stevensoni TaxID=69355 RepID=A0A7R9A5J1_9CRUS|nr:unnamed protein product [Darwinula stevensoni]CAG0894510.1 unnamed protein product [Darwinula stevensoni]